MQFIYLSYQSKKHSLLRRHFYHRIFSWHNINMRDSFSLWGNGLVEAINSLDKMEIKRMTHYLHVTLVYLHLLSLQNLSRLYDCVFLCFRNSALKVTWTSPQAPAGDLRAHFLSVFCHVLYCSSNPWLHSFPK